MPIEIDFEKEEKDLDEYLNELRRLEKLIINFLKENKGKGITKAFTKKEIISLTKINPKLMKPYKPKTSIFYYDPIDTIFQRFDDHEIVHVEYRDVKNPDGKYVNYYYYED